MQRSLTYIGHPVLRRKAAPIKQIDSSIFQLIEDMKNTLLHTSNGVALAAPQVGASVQLFIVRCLENPDDLSSVTDQFRIYINSHVDKVSQKTWVEEEGCLSIPDVYRPVERPYEITLTAQDETGKTFTETYTGWAAKIILHENDHIHGAFFIDRLSKQEKKALSLRIEQVKKQFEDHNTKLVEWPFGSRTS